MNYSSEIPFVQADQAWYFLSIYYARENWTELAAQINQFYQDRRTLFCACLISFSEDKGERIDISLASSLLQENLKEEIDGFFLSFIENAPSLSKTIFPYGNAVWGNYQNNMLLWYRHRTIHYNNHYIHFHQTSFQFALLLIEGDTSSDTLFSLCLYFFAKGLTCIELEKQKSVLSDALNEASIDFKNFGHIVSVKKLINEHVDFQEISLALDAYRDERESDFSPGLEVWLTNTKTLMNFYSYSRYCSFICDMFGLKGLHQLMILEMMNTWYNTK